VGPSIVYLEFGNVAHRTGLDFDPLEHCLREGLASTEGPDPRTVLGCSREATDADVARALVRAVSGRDIDEIGSMHLDPDAARHPSIRPPTEVTADPSFLGRLSTASSADLSVDHIDDMATLLAVLRAGSRRQRRAALMRVRERIADRRLLHTDATRKAIQTVAELRDVELGYELSKTRVELSGSPGREARQEHEQWKRLAQRVASDIRAFWDGQLSVEPIHILPGDERALLLLRICELPDVVVNHITAIIEGTDGAVPSESRIGLLASLRYATDRRLVPALVSVLEAERGELVARAARGAVRAQLSARRAPRFGGRPRNAR
jgi:hypothetical protein